MRSGDDERCEQHETGARNNKNLAVHSGKVTVNDPVGFVRTCWLH